MKTTPVLSAFAICAASIVIAAEPVPPFSGSIERLDPKLDTLIAPEAKIEVLASGFNWAEGPVWYQGGIVFSDVPENTAFMWKEGQTEAAVFLKPSGATKPEGGQGSNGLAVDARGNLILCQHGDRRVARLERDGKFTTLAGRLGDHLFNSPNDLVVASNGDIFFTDPPYGLKDKASREIEENGVYHLGKGGVLRMVVKDLTFPNGIALSPDEKTLFVAVSDPAATRVMAYDLAADGSAANARVFFDAQPLKKPGLKGGCDGMKVDAQGNVWTTGPGGVLVISKEGKHLGTILTGQATANCAWGDDGGTLYVTADMFLLRVKTLVKGAGFRPSRK
ncbi:MAG: SMP-30/gluconolactonase/LRE family protein [Verrucomicrobiaceae bacterium]|nr:SMP-30/gluconolactonase/LRE family protein [Verrucomicrobiaceae bacterium]